MCIESMCVDVHRCVCVRAPTIVPLSMCMNVCRSGCPESAGHHRFRRGRLPRGSGLVATQLSHGLPPQHRLRKHQLIGLRLHASASVGSLLTHAISLLVSNSGPPRQRRQRAPQTLCGCPFLCRSIRCATQVARFPLQVQPSVLAGLWGCKNPFWRDVGGQGGGRETGES